MWVIAALFYVIVLAVVAAASLVILAGAAVYSTLLGIAAFWRTSTEFFGSPSPAERLNPDGPADPADYGYLAGPALRDYWQLAGAGFAGVYRRLLRLSDDMPNGSLLAWLLWRQRWLEATELTTLFPFVGMGVGFVAGFLGASAFVTATLLVQLVILSVIVACVLLTSGVLWLLETGILTLRGITTECGNCHQRLTRPMFACQCGRAHRNLMPGRQGTFRRTCRCGRQLPTLLMLGKRGGAVPKCGQCGTPLPRMTQSVPTCHLPIVGGISSGKSVFMHAAIARLCRDHEHAVEFADKLASDRFAQGRERLQKGYFVPHTLPGQPIAYTVQFGPHLLYFYDAAGEVLEQSRHMVVSSFIELSDGVILVVDPFALPAVRARADAIARREARPSEADPKEVLDGLVQTLREYRGKSSAPLALRVAVVITKADALLTVPNLRHPYMGLATSSPARTAAVRRWLIDQGHGDVVNSLHNHFSEVRYFIVTYLDHAAVTPRPHVDGGPSVANDDPAAPIRWLLTGDRP